MRDLPSETAPVSSDSEYQEELFVLPFPFEDSSALRISLEYPPRRAPVPAGVSAARGGSRSGESAHEEEEEHQRVGLARIPQFGTELNPPLITENTAGFGIGPVC